MGGWCRFKFDECSNMLDPIISFQCCDCNISFKEKKSFTRHILMCNNKGKLFKCDKCDFSSPRQSNLDRHKLVHQNAVSSSISDELQEVVAPDAVLCSCLQGAVVAVAK